MLCYANKSLQKVFAFSLQECSKVSDCNERNLYFLFPLKLHKTQTQLWAVTGIKKPVSLIAFLVDPSVCPHSPKCDDPAFLLVKIEQNLALIDA